jgi:bifunctional DNA-binding transcriptional regulator/antitoxin component of YhaV-PrlF toxin-antitoxin module
VTPLTTDVDIKGRFTVPSLTMMYFGISLAVMDLFTAKIVIAIKVFQNECGR